MRRVALFSLLCMLVISLAAPSGAAFALGETVSELATAPQDTPEEASDDIPELLPKPEDPSMSGKVESKVLSEEPTPPADTSFVAAPAEGLPTSPLLITAYKASGAHMHAVQLYNNSSNMVPTDSVTLLYVAGGEEYEIPLVDGWVQPRSYMVVAWQGESEYADSEFRFDSIGGGLLESVELYHEGYQPVIVPVPSTYAGELLHRYTSAAGNYTTNTSFIPGEATISGGGLYVLPDRPDLSVRELLVHPRDCTYGLETTDCYDYIKLRNDGSTPINLGLYRLRSGYSNSSSSSTNTTYFDEVLGPGDVVTLTHDKEGQRVRFAANDGTVWLEDLYGFVSYDLGVAPYIDSDLAAQAGRSWAYNDELEKWQWATPSPFEVGNNFALPPESGKGAASQGSGLVPCRENQYRSKETNRCRTLASPSVLKPCREGQYRSEETNRCRSIATAAAHILKPCADGQFRNPATNRCKKIASTDDIALADCGEGRERNPETNRCRNVMVAGALTDTLPFPVEEVAGGKERFAGWWVLGIITAAGAAYGVWEWREELLRAGRRASQFVTRSK